MTNYNRNFGSNSDLMNDLENLGREDVDITEGPAPAYEQDLDNFIAKYGQDEQGLTADKDSYILADDDTMAELNDLGEVADDMRLVSADYEHRDTGIKGLLDEEEVASEPAQTDTGIDVIR